MDWTRLRDATWLTDEPLTRDVIATLLLLVAALGLRTALLKLIRRTAWADEVIRGRWRMQVRHATLAVVGLGLFLIWGSELRTLALSLVAVAVALVIATKELILCAMGAVLRTSAHSFTVGDRIEIGNARGDVIDAGVLATHILETGPAHQRTGRAIVVPNSIFLSTPAINETFTGQDHLLHTITVPLNLSDDWHHAERALIEAAQRVTEEYEDATRASLTSAAKNHLPSDDEEPRSLVKPQVLVNVPAAGQLTLTVRVPTPVREKGTVEQKILRRYLELMSAEPREHVRVSDFTELRSSSGR